MVAEPFYTAVLPEKVPFDVSLLSITICQRMTVSRTVSFSVQVSVTDLFARTYRWGDAARTLTATPHQPLHTSHHTASGGMGNLFR